MLRAAAASGLAAFALLLLAPLAVPAPAQAASRVFPAGYWGPILSCTGNYNNVVPSGVNGGPTNTCNDFCDFLRTAQNGVDFAITIVIFVGAPAMITFGGIMLLISGDAEERRSHAKSIIMGAVVGVVIVLGAYLVVSTFLWLAGNSAGGVKVSWPNIDCTLPPPPSTT